MDRWTASINPPGSVLYSLADQCCLKRGGYRAILQKDGHSYRLWLPNITYKLCMYLVVIALFVCIKCMLVSGADLPLFGERLKSASSGTAYMFPESEPSLHGLGAFSVAGLQVWNHLPANPRSLHNNRH